MNVRFYLLYDSEFTLKSHFLREKVEILSLCTKHYYEGHYVTLLNLYTTTWCYITPILYLYNLKTN